MWAGSTANEAGQLGGVRATNHAGFGLDETSAATSYPAPGAAAAAPAAGGATNPPRPPSLPPPLPPAMPYPWDHHHLRHHEEVAVSLSFFCFVVDSQLKKKETNNAFGQCDPTEANFVDFI